MGLGKLAPSPKQCQGGKNYENQMSSNVASKISTTDVAEFKNALKEKFEDLPDWVSVTECADWLNCHKNTVLRMIRQNVLPAEPLNPAAKRKTYRIRKIDLLHRLGMVDASDGDDYVPRHFKKK